VLSQNVDGVPLGVRGLDVTVRGVVTMEGFNPSLVEFRADLPFLASSSWASEISRIHLLSLR
jgi:hypothetical protein